MRQIYLNNATTSYPKPEEMKEYFCRFADKMNELGGRGGGEAARASGVLFSEVRSEVAEMFGVNEPENVIFTRGTTEGVSLVLKGFLKAGDKVFISPMEHNAVVRPLNRLVAERGISYDLLPANEKGLVDWEEAKQFEKQVGKPALIVLIHVSSVNAVVQDIEKARKAFPETPILLDAAQSAGVFPIDIAKSGIDFLCCSAHKGLYGPTGVGIAYISPKFEVTPLVDGATRLHAEGTQPPNVRPDKFEAGTPNLHGVAALQGSMKYLKRVGYSHEHKRELSGLLTEAVSFIDRICIQSPVDGTQTFVCITIDGIKAGRVMDMLYREYGVICRAGIQCAELAHRHLGTFPDGTVRLSPGIETTREEIEIAAEAIREIAK